MNLKGKDQDAIQEYELELRLYQEELERERQLTCVDELMTRKLADIEAKAQQVGHMGTAGEPEASQYSPRDAWN